jgi:hypothetical protein
VQSKVEAGDQAATSKIRTLEAARSSGGLMKEAGSGAWPIMLMQWGQQFFQGKSSSWTSDIESS